MYTLHKYQAVFLGRMVFGLYVFFNSGCNPMIEHVSYEEYKKTLRQIKGEEPIECDEKEFYKKALRIAEEAEQDTYYID
jgi:hypothetical protein